MDVHVPQAGDQEFSTPVDYPGTRRNRPHDRRDAIAFDHHRTVRQRRRRRNVDHRDVLNCNRGLPGKAHQQSEGETLHLLGQDNLVRQR